MLLAAFSLHHSPLLRRSDGIYSKSNLADLVFSLYYLDEDRVFLTQLINFFLPAYAVVSLSFVTCLSLR